MFFQNIKYFISLTRQDNRELERKVHLLEKELEETQRKLEVIHNSIVNSIVMGNVP